MTEICFHSVVDCRYYNSINLGIRLSTVRQYLMEHLMVVMASKLTTARNCKQKKILLKYLFILFAVSKIYNLVEHNLHTYHSTLS